MKTLISFSLALLALSCSRSPRMIEKKDGDLIAKHALGENFLVIDNKSSSHVLYMKKKKTSPLSPEKSVSFIVVDTKKNKIVLKDEIPNGSVEWANDEEIKVITLPGIIPENASYKIGYTFNLKTLKKKVLMRDNRLKKNILNE